MASRSPQIVLRLFLSFALLLLLLAGAEVLLWATGKVEDPADFQFRRVTRTLEQDVDLDGIGVSDDRGYARQDARGGR